MNDYDAHLALTLLEQNEVKRLRAQRDALLETCKVSLAFLDSLPFDDYPPGLDFQLRAVIRLVEEGREITPDWKRKAHDAFVQELKDAVLKAQP